MKFNKYIPLETRMLLERQYKEYIKETPMTDKEKHAVREWVKNGNSVYENSCDAWAESRVPIEFLTEYFAPSAPSIRFIAPPIRATAPCSM